MTEKNKKPISRVVFLVSKDLTNCPKYLSASEDENASGPNNVVNKSFYCKYWHWVT